MLVWIEGTSMLGVLSEEEIAQFIMRVVSCALPDKNTSPTLYNRVSQFQRHKHISYCMRNKNTERGFMKVCRFGFDRPVTEEFVLRNVQTSIVGRRNLKQKLDFMIRHANPPNQILMITFPYLRCCGMETWIFNLWVIIRRHWSLISSNIS